MEIAQIIDEALEEHYSELGLPVPNWKQKKDPDWWLEYLKELGLDSDNPQCYNTITQRPYHGLQTYSPEWHRKRYLKEALDKYFDDYVDTDVIRQDILDVLSERSERAYAEFAKVNELEKSLN